MYTGRTDDEYGLPLKEGDFILRLSKESPDFLLLHRDGTSDLTRMVRNGQALSVYEQISPQAKFSVKLTSNYNENGRVISRKIDIMDLEKQNIVWSKDELPRYFQTFRWYGDTIGLPGQSYSDGEEDLPFIHLPTGIMTLKNDSLPTGRTEFVRFIYNFDPSEYITMSDPIVVTADGKMIRYTGQGTFITSDNVVYIPLNDFITGIGGSLDVTEQAVTIKYSNQTLGISLQDNEVINYAGRLYVKLWDIAPKLGFLVELQDRPAQNKTYVLKSR
jgi:hypothetical protein